MYGFAATCKKHILKFKKPAGTSRGYLYEKPCYFLYVKDNEDNSIGVGECSYIPNLSIDDRPDYEEKLKEVCDLINSKNSPSPLSLDLKEFPSIKFGLETAFLDLQNGGTGILFNTDFTDNKCGIPINGLIWMGSFDEMWEQVISKIESGYKVIKLKIGALDFDNELRLLDKIREHYPGIELRLDANGAFSKEEAAAKLEILSRYDIHSIEQPIKQGQWEAMAELCLKSPVPIALDEELIGINSMDDKIRILDSICPQYIILKPSLIGGFKAAEEWIKLAEERHIGWWATSALESNLGLGVIAQWVASILEINDNILPQGLGTGGLYENNIESTLNIKEGKLFFD